MSEDERLQPIKEERNLMRDPDSNAVVNTDTRSLKKYKRQKQKNRKIDKMESEIDDIRDQLKDIKNMIGKFAPR